MILLPIYNPHNLHGRPLQTLTNPPLHFHPLMLRPRIHQRDFQLPRLPTNFLFRAGFVSPAGEPTDTRKPSAQTGTNRLSAFLLVELNGEETFHGRLWGAGGRELSDELPRAGIYQGLDFGDFDNRKSEVEDIERGRVVRREVAVEEDRVEDP